MNKNVMRKILIALRIVLGAIFIFAAIDKIADPGGFADNIDNYRILPYFVVTIMAAVLPWVEFLCGLFLIVGRLVRGASLLVVLMNVVFIVAISSALARGLDIDCGCFTTGAGGSRVGLVRVAEDVAFLLSAGMIYYYSAIKSLK